MWALSQRHRVIIRSWFIKPPENMWVIIVCCCRNVDLFFYFLSENAHVFFSVTFMFQMKTSQHSLDLHRASFSVWSAVIVLSAVHNKTFRISLWRAVMWTYIYFLQPSIFRIVKNPFQILLLFATQSSCTFYALCPTNKNHYSHFRRWMLVSRPNSCK